MVGIVFIIEAGFCALIRVTFSISVVSFEINTFISTLKINQWNYEPFVVGVSIFFV